MLLTWSWLSHRQLHQWSGSVPIIIVHSLGGTSSSVADLQEIYVVHHLLVIDGNDRKSICAVISAGSKHDVSKMGCNISTLFFQLGHVHSNQIRCNLFDDKGTSLTVHAKQMWSIMRREYECGVCAKRCSDKPPSFLCSWKQPDGGAFLRPYTGSIRNEDLSMDTHLSLL